MCDSKQCVSGFLCAGMYHLPRIPCLPLFLLWASIKCFLSILVSKYSDVTYENGGALFPHAYVLSA